MSAGQRPSTLHDKLKRSVISPAAAATLPATNFREQKRPRFTIPKTPARETSPSPGSPHRFATIESPTVRSQRKPQFQIPRASPAHHSPAVKRFATPSTRVDEEIDSSDTIVPTIRNPFDVSEELDEPSIASPGPRPRFTTQATPRRETSRTTTNRRTTAEFLSTIKFSPRETRRDLVPSADWSPHRSRTRGSEKRKFKPGGMAETVALWIYEAQQARNR